MKILPIKALLLLLAFFTACSLDDKQDAWKQEIAQTETAFNKMAAEKGIAEAFRHFASDSAVLLRNNVLITGEDDIYKYLTKGKRSQQHLEWTPLFIDVSKSGDMAYTYGTYIYSFQDSTESTIKSTGYFHTVWKRQSNGEWKFVWD